MIGIGILHLVLPGPFVSIVPAALPAPYVLVLISGFFGDPRRRGAARPARTSCRKLRPGARSTWPYSPPTSTWRSTPSSVAASRSGRLGALAAPVRPHRVGAYGPAPSARAREEKQGGKEERSRETLELRILGSFSPPLPMDSLPPAAARSARPQEFDVLLLLEEHAEERELPDEPLAPDVALHEDRDPVDELTRRGALAEARHLRSS